MPKHVHDDPYARVFDVEEDDFDDYHAHEDLLERDELGVSYGRCHRPQTKLTVYA